MTMVDFLVAHLLGAVAVVHSLPLLLLLVGLVPLLLLGSVAILLLLGFLPLEGLRVPLHGSKQVWSWW